MPLLASPGVQPSQLEVRNCLELSLGADEGDEDATVWVSIEASDPGVAVSIVEGAAVRVEREGATWAVCV